MIQQVKEKGRFYRNQQNKVLESVTEVTDIDAIIQQAEEAEQNYMIDNPNPNILINLYEINHPRLFFFVHEKKRIDCRNADFLFIYFYVNLYESIIPTFSLQKQKKETYQFGM